MHRCAALVLVCSTVAFTLLQSGSAVEQIHITLGDTDSEMRVLWATPSNVTSWVSYGTQRGDRLKRTQRSENLRQGRRYFYRVYAEGSPVSRMYNFTTLPVHKNVSMTYLVYGDLGVRDGTDTFPALQAELAHWNHTAVWHIGDEFLRLIEPVASSLPYMVSPGNHEIAGDFLHYRTRFSTPGTPWPIPKGKMWYSYDIGLVHFISYSTEVYFTYNEEYECSQYYWLLEDLVKANRNRARVPWIVAMGHRPMYCSNADADDCTGWLFGGRVRAGLENLFHTQGVDLIVEAHEHSYERLWPVYNYNVIQTNYVNPRGSVHVISGAAGNQEGNDKFGPYSKAWSAYRHSKPRDNNFGRLHVHNRTHIHWQQVRVKDGHVFDSFWLVQHEHGPFVPNANCTLSVSTHSSCHCPSPFYVLVLTYAAMFMACFAVIAVVAKLCWRWRMRIFGKCYVWGVLGQRPYLVYKTLSSKQIYEEEDATLISADEPSFFVGRAQGIQ
ncbi:hypothetical protein BaRGS_00040252 [Batillaria attramentaria]|uniref:Purple acid phosphatase n=1 Tax=Batillaria attramentaria TaxID=370345 RepID=A0ABD0J0Y5_9CAEN